MVEAIAAGTGREGQEGKIEYTDLFGEEIKSLPQDLCLGALAHTFLSIFFLALQLVLQLAAGTAAGTAAVASAMHLAILGSDISHFFF